MKILLNAGGLAETNSYLLVDESTKTAAIIDAPGDTTGKIVGPHLEAAKQNGWDIQYLLLTHGHWDHLSDHKFITDAFPNAKILMHQLDAPMLENPGSQRFPLPYIIPARQPDALLTDNQTIQLGNLTITALHVPGHTPGHLVFHVPEHKILFTGDLLFAGAIGRYDFPGGNLDHLKSSLHRILQLPDDTQILPGHGPSTTIANEKNGNPFIRRWRLHQ